MKRTMLATMVMGLMVSVALCEDMVENPAYKSWSAFKVDTVVKMQMSTATKMGDMEMATKMAMTSTLKELTPDKAVVEIVAEMEMNGTKTAMPPQKQEIPAKVAAGAATQPAAGITVTKKAEGDEEIAVGDKKYKCHWVENQMTGQQMEGTSKTWTCADVPGGVVKMLTNTTKPMTSQTTTELTEFKAAG